MKRLYRTSPSAMRRSRLRTLMRFLLLGAAVTVGVAWGCALFVTISFPAYPARSVRAPWPAAVPPNWATLADVREASNWAGSLASASGDTIAPESHTVKLLDASQYVETWGVPCRSMGRHINRDGYTEAWGALPASWREGLVAPWLDGYPPRCLPLELAWPGFAINTIFYAAICWLLYATPSAIRLRVRMRRIKRGLCPACAYPIGASDLCTECGKPVKSHTAVANSSEVRQK